MTLAVELVLVNAVREVDEELGAGGALEAGRVPLDVLAELGRHDAKRSGRNVLATSVALPSFKTIKTVQISRRFGVRHLAVRIRTVLRAPPSLSSLT